MRLWKKLQNPYLLVGQGFVLGGALFFATHPGSLQAASQLASPPPAASALTVGAR
jgi:hypothetical protein